MSCDPPRQRVEGADSHAAQFVPLDEIARQCDIVTFHTPLTLDGCDTTYHLADSDFFAAAKPGAIIINSSRGEVVDTLSLSAAVERGTCSCAIDTWEHEPDIDRRLSAQSMISTPHIAGYTAQGKANATSMTIRAIATEFGLPLADWYPADEVPRIAHRPISWDELCLTIRDYFDIEALNKRFKADTSAFETIRNTYIYRPEYF
jgi:erythronate-4-phosphate dehydrogenase